MTAWGWLVRVRGLARRAVELARVVVAEPWWWLSRSGRLWWHHKVTATLYPLATATLWHFGIQLGAVLSIVPVLAVAGWARLGPISYDRRVRLPLLRRRVRREVIELWPGLMESVGLARRTPIATRRSGDQVTPADRVELPVLARLGWQDHWTLVGWPRLLLGQTVEDVEAVVDRLRVGVRAYRCRVVANPSLTACTIVWSFDDSLARPFEAQVPAADAPVSDLRWLPMGRTEDGGVWWLPFCRSTMTAGCSGAGKASLLWGLLFALGPAIRTGLVVVLGIDLKGGMELSMGAPMFTRYACRVEAAVVMLEDAVRDLQARAERLAGITRQHTPSVEDPLVVVVVDELAVLIAYAPDPKLVARAEAALSTLLSQGRAVGFVVIGFVQDPRKETVRMRHLFIQAIGLRLREKSEVAMVLSDGAVAAGALCHKIPDTMPGVAFVLGEDNRPVRVRAGHVSDAMIKLAAARFPAPTQIPIVIPEPVESSRPRTARSSRASSRAAGEGDRA